MPALTTVTRARQRCGAAPHIDLSNPWRYCLLPAPQYCCRSQKGTAGGTTLDRIGIVPSEDPSTHGRAVGCNSTHLGHLFSSTDRPPPTTLWTFAEARVRGGMLPSARGRGRLPAGTEGEELWCAVDRIPEIARC